MAEQTAPVTPAAPAPAAPTPAAPAAPKTMDTAGADILAARAGQRSQSAPTTSQPTNGTPTPAAGTTPTAPAKPKRAFKFDHAEEEADETWFADEAKWTRLKDLAEKGYGSDRRIERTRTETRESLNKAWNDCAAENGFDVVPAPGTKSGWKFVAKQQPATPAAATTETADPLAKEEAEIRARVKTQEATGEDFVRLTEIAEKRAKLSAITEWEAKQAAQTAEAAARKSHEDAKGWLFGEVDKFIAARAKSFDGPDQARRTARLRMAAFTAGLTAAEQGRQALDAAKAVIFEEADDLDARTAHYRASLPTQSVKPEAPSIVGAVPAGGSANGHQSKNLDEAGDAILKARWRR